MQVIIDTVTSRLRAMDGSALSPETKRDLVEAALAAMRAELAHEQQVRRERSLDNGYLDRLGSEGR
ncbi:MAG: hypothetical protein ACOZCP_09605 [Pseudomonadota bacterium]